MPPGGKGLGDYKDGKARSAEEGRVGREWVSQVPHKTRNQAL